MRVIVVLIILVFFVVCGVDGVFLCFSVNVGIGVGFNGVSVGGKVSVGKGLVIVLVGF